MSDQAPEGRDQRDAAGHEKPAPVRSWGPEAARHRVAHAASAPVSKPSVVAAPSGSSVNATAQTQRLQAGPLAAEVRTAPRNQVIAPRESRDETAVRRTRRARLRVTRLDPWSVMKTAFLFSIAGGVILFVAVWVMWAVIEGSGVLSSLENTINGLVVAPGASQKFAFGDYISQWKVLGFTAILAAVDVVIITALATLFSFLYNLSAQVLGGLEVTLAED